MYGYTISSTATTRFPEIAVDIVKQNDDEGLGMEEEKAAAEQRYETTATKLGIVLNSPRAI